jgi:hypothetical protein
MANTHLDNLQRAQHEFNEKYLATRQDIERTLAEDDETVPEAERVIESLDALDNVLDKLVTYLEHIDQLI